MLCVFYPENSYVLDLHWPEKINCNGHVLVQFIHSTTRCLEVSFADNSHQILTKCFKGTSFITRSPVSNFSYWSIDSVTTNLFCFFHPSFHRIMYVAVPSRETNYCLDKLQFIWALNMYTSTEQWLWLRCKFLLLWLQCKFGNVNYHRSTFKIDYHNQ